MREKELKIRKKKIGTALDRPFSHPLGNSARGLALHVLSSSGVQARTETHQVLAKEIEEIFRLTRVLYLLSQEALSFSSK